MQKSWMMVPIMARGPGVLALSMTLLLASFVTTACQSSDRAAPEATTVTKTVETTPANLPDLDCQAPAVDLDVKWRRDYGEGIPPNPAPDQVVPREFFEVWALVSAKARVKNLSPNSIFTRGITFGAEWINEKGELQSTRYQYRGLIQSGVENVPELPPVGSTQERSPERVDGGSSIEFSREYHDSNPWNLRVRLREVSDHQNGPYTWLSDTDWWFADEAVRQRCGQR